MLLLPVAVTVVVDVGTPKVIFYILFFAFQEDHFFLDYIMNNPRTIALSVRKSELFL
jgi:hypothetical protein